MLDTPLDTPLGTETPKTLGRLPERVATIAPATPASAAPEASSGTFALRASGPTSPAPFLIDSATPLDRIESATPFDVEADFDFELALFDFDLELALVAFAFVVALDFVDALPFAGERLEPLAFEPLDFELEDREPPELELDFRALDFAFVWATCASFLPAVATRATAFERTGYPLLDEIINRNGMPAVVVIRG